MNRHVSPRCTARLPAVLVRSASASWGLVVVVALLGASAGGSARAQATAAADSHPLKFIDTSFENASPLYWEIDAQGVVHVYLVYDQERCSPNRANGHWHFGLEARPNCDLTLVLHNFDNVWNGQHASPLDDRVICFTSLDGRQWQVVKTKTLEGNLLQIQVHMEADRLYVARLEPYRLSDLERLKQSLAGQPLVEITPIGRTVEGRALEILRIGDPAAPRRVLLRAGLIPGSRAAIGWWRASSSGFCVVTTMLAGT